MILKTIPKKKIEIPKKSLFSIFFIKSLMMNLRVYVIVILKNI